MYARSRSLKLPSNLHVLRHATITTPRPTSRFASIPSMNKSRIEPSKSTDAELLGLERDSKIDIQKDPRTEPDFPEIRMKGPRSKNKEYRSKTPSSHKQNVYNRAGIEKPHAEWGWSPLHDRTAEQWNWKDNQRANKDISREEKQHWPELPKDLILRETAHSERDKYYNPNDLTTFESYSESARSATFKAALNVGVHWGKEKRRFNPSMAPYMKGVVDGRHIFDLTLTMSNLRKMIRLLQSLIMDECNILFVCNARDVEMKTLARIMCTRVNMPLLDSRWMPGSLTNWDWMAENFRGPGRALIDGKKPAHRFWKTSKLHRMIQQAPDFIFLFNRDQNDILVHEANRCAIPVASLCDSDDSTRDLQYVIPCNTQSVQAVHFVLDMLTRGILEAQSKMDSVWWARQKDLEVDRNALYDAEVEWQYKYDAYQQQRVSGRMMAGGDDGDSEKLHIATNYVKDDQDVTEKATEKKLVFLHPSGIPSFPINNEATASGGGIGEHEGFAMLDAAEQSRQQKMKSVLENRSTEYMRTYRENEEKNAMQENKNAEFTEKFGLPQRFQSISDFSLQQMQDYTQSQMKYRQRLASMTKPAGKSKNAKQK